jgi:hypothetical protein
MEKRAITVTEGFDRQEEAGAAGDPLALIWAQAAARDQIMYVRMIFQGTGPGVEHGQQAQLGTKSFRIVGQVL